MADEDGRAPKRCPLCSAEILEGAVICSACSAYRDATKRCLDCKTYIPEQAVKCTGCGAFQDRRRLLNFSSTVLSLMIALISVVTVGIPGFLGWLYSESRTQASFIELRGEFIRTLFYNKGKKPSYIVGSVLHDSALRPRKDGSRPNDGDAKLWMPLYIKGKSALDESYQVIESGKSVQLDLRAEASDISKRHRVGGVGDVIVPEGKCSVTTTVVESDGRHRRLKIRQDRCSEFEEFLAKY